MYRLGPCIPIFRGGGGVIKNTKRMCIYEYVILFIIDTCEKCLLRFKKGHKHFCPR